MNRIAYKKGTTNNAEKKKRLSKNSMCISKKARKPRRPKIKKELQVFVEQNTMEIALQEVASDESVIFVETPVIDLTQDDTDILPRITKKGITLNIGNNGIATSLIKLNKEITNTTSVLAFPIGQNVTVLRNAFSNYKLIEPPYKRLVRERLSVLDVPQKFIDKSLYSGDFHKSDLNNRDHEFIENVCNLQNKNFKDEVQSNEPVAAFEATP